MGQNNNRKYDLIIWGATGFTGQLVCEYLLKHKEDSELNWAMGGRSIDKLERLRRRLSSDAIDLVVADSLDPDSLNSMCAQSRVICSTVGPYAKYGSELVKACVENGTHYCDLTGEAQWIRRMIDTHHEKAKENKVKIVHSCGFDSVPSDMGVLYLQKEAKEQMGSYCNHIKYRVRAIKGGMSGGTYASLSYILEQARTDPEVFKVMGNPYGLNPVNDQKGQDGRDLQSVVFDKDLNKWIFPFVMAGINTKIVRRSHALAGWCYGRDFKYDEAVISGAGLTGRLKGISAAVGLGLVMSAKPGGILKRLIDRTQPKPGEGPTREQRESGFFNIQLIGKLADGRRIDAKVTGDRDPGYGSTSKMLGQSAICLARDHDKCPETYGILTPATALGAPLLERLQSYAGLGFSIIDKTD